MDQERAEREAIASLKRAGALSATSSQRKLPPGPIHGTYGSDPLKELPAHDASDAPSLARSADESMRGVMRGASFLSTPEDSPSEQPGDAADGEAEEESSEKDKTTLSVVRENLRRQQIEELFDAALRGDLTSDRELGAHEPEQFAPQHLQMVLMRAAGVSQKRIALELGFTPVRVGQILRHPYSRILLSKLISYASDEILDTETRMEALTGEAVDQLATVLRTSKDEKLKTKVAFGLLDRRGYGRIEKKRVEHSFVMPAEKANLLMEALSESKEIQDVNYVIYDSRITTETSADELESSPKGAETDHLDVGRPPASDSPAHQRARAVNE